MLSGKESSAYSQTCLQRQQYRRSICIALLCVKGRSCLEWVVLENARVSRYRKRVSFTVLPATALTPETHRRPNSLHGKQHPLRPVVFLSVVSVFTSLHHICSCFSIFDRAPSGLDVQCCGHL